MSSRQLPQPQCLSALLAAQIERQLLLLAQEIHGDVCSQIVVVRYETVRDLTWLELSLPGV